ncbi:hypothetical protein LTR53_012568 [Teratosphaeriaceae sp. CCFEE 6253]|nr:hypothetical protein LTR53_012568 [Teratosphaeriaceae sp. CCFEE 6253]
MFSAKLARAATHAPSSSPALPRTSACLAARPRHQRRPSSSKASCPPDNNKPAPAAKAAAPATPATTSVSDPADVTPAPTLPRRSKRSSRLRSHGALVERVSKEKTATAQQQHPVLPSVPRVDHLNEKDVGLSAFFSLHRPLSVTTTIPPPTTTEAFNAIFASRTDLTRDQWADGDSATGKPEDVIYTLHNTIQSLESSITSAQQEDGVRWEVLQESPSHADTGIKHLDSPTPLRAKSLDEVVATFKPFQTPPPPQSFLAPKSASSDTPNRRSAAVLEKLESSLRKVTGLLTKKSYQTTITVHEVTDPKGQKSYSAESSPIIPIPSAAVEVKSADPAAPVCTGRAGFLRIPVTHPLHPLHARYPQGPVQPFRERLRRREKMYLTAHPEQSQVVGEMLEGIRERSVRRAPVAGKRVVRMELISVKRQRKLKMKKHKYKKLMKRTRNLRRRLDRA